MRSVVASDDSRLGRVGGVAVRWAVLVGGPDCPLPRSPGRQPLEPVLAERAGLDMDLDLRLADRSESFLDEARELLGMGTGIGDHEIIPREMP